jgi:hypothetical protein
MERVSMRSLKVVSWFFAVALPVLSVSALAADGFDDEFEEKPWAEIEVQLPAFPEKENLIPFRVGVVVDTKYLVDGSSLSVGTDSVVRYTLLVVSPSGAQNISYEGMRCATGERRSYAFGRSDRTWSKARSNQWVRVQGGSNNPHVSLLTSYFCAVGAPSVMTAEDARRVLRSGGQLPFTAS